MPARADSSQLARRSQGLLVKARGNTDERRLTLLPPNTLWETLSSANVPHSRKEGSALTLEF